MTIKWKNRRDICLTVATYDDKMVPTWVRGQVTEKPKVVTDYNSRMGGVDLSDAYLTSYRSTRKRLKKCCQKHFRHLTDICSLNSHLLREKMAAALPGWNFEFQNI
jgi:hypothetical protein